MAKSNQIKKFVNGEIADADEVNQSIEDTGSEGGSIPYNPTTDEKSTDGSQSLGATAYPWGSLYINRDSYLYEVDASSHTLASSVLIKDLRRFINLKDCPSSFSGHASKAVTVKPDETGLEFSSQTLATAGDFLVSSADSSAGMDYDSYTKVKEIFIPKAGTLRIKFTFNYVSTSMYMRVYRNGVAVGTEWILNSTDTKSEDISGWSIGDLCQLYVKRSSTSDAATITDFRIYEGFPSDYIVTLN